MSTATLSTFTDRALGAVRRGLSIIPCAPRKKSPLAAHGAKSRTNTEAGVLAFAAMVPKDSNYGICSDENFTIVETDDRAKLFEKLGQPIPPTLCVSANPNRGYWVFAHTDKSRAVKGSPKASEGFVEWRNFNQYCCGWGSIHPDTGKEYALVKDLPPAPMPDWLVDKLLELTKHRVAATKPTISETREGDTGSFTHESLGELLQLWSDSNPEFFFVEGKVENGQGYWITCPGDFEKGWPDGAKHSEHSSGFTSTIAAWVAPNRHARWKCFHTHCENRGWNELKAVLDKGEQRRVLTGSPLLGPSMPDHNAAPNLTSFKLPLPKPDKLLRQTDMGNAERFAKYFKDCFRHTPERGWYSWDGRRWEPEAFAPVMRAAMLTARSIQGESQLVPVPEGDKEAESLRSSFVKWAKLSESKQRLDAAIGLAKASPDICVSLQDFDKDEWLFNCANGTIDLRSGALLNHTRGHMLSAISPVPFVEDARCPQFLAFLEWAMKGDQQMISFLRRAAGYAMTGSTSEQCFFLSTGRGRNGKSTFIELLSKIMGDYSTPTAFSTFVQKKNDGGIPNDLAALRYSRMVIAAEAEKTQKLAESLIKSLTGGERISARFLHGEYFSFQPKFKIFMSTNFRPQISGTDDGIWRRVKLIPWENQIPEVDVDEKLPAKLYAEAPGILQWMLQGLAEYQKIRLATPEKVDLASKKYRKEEDGVGRFISEACEEGGEYPAEQLYQAYRYWCEQVKERAVPLKHFRPDMEGRGYERRHTMKGTVYQGLRPAK